MKPEEIIKWRQEVHDARLMSIQLQAIDVPDSVGEAISLPSPRCLVWPGGNSIDELLSVNPRAREFMSYTASLVYRRVT